LALLGLTTGALVAYAKFDPTFRKQAAENVPGFDEFVKIVAQEEKSFGETFNAVSNFATTLLVFCSS